MSLSADDLKQRWRRDIASREPTARVGALLATMFALLLVGCNGAKNAYVPPPPPKVVVAQPVQKPVTLYLNLTGNTSAFRSVDLVARVQGFLTDIDYTDGAAVKAGDKLFGIERDQYQAQLDQANATLASNQATLAYNQAEYGRQAQLGKQDFASQATVQEWKVVWATFRSAGSWPAAAGCTEAPPAGAAGAGADDETAAS